ncbi:MAG TPA: hypothetical protein VM221_10255 [Armatimonadota bacterium]|nr:hypothetical protein [Armatimonadota bacterium]
MERCISLWHREMGDQILVGFSRPNFRTPISVLEGQLSPDQPPLYDDIPRLLKSMEDHVDTSSHPWDEIDDDTSGIPIFMPDCEFGCGVMGAMFDAPVIQYSTPKHTITYNTAIVSGAEDVARLACNPDNAFIRQVLSGLRYFVAHARKPFAIILLHALEGGDFLVAMRGETQALLDLADGAPFVDDLFQLGLESASLLFELRRDIVIDYNVAVYGDREYAWLAPQHLQPTLDTDTDVMCSPQLFAAYGLRYKQEILNRFGGGSLYIHTRGMHLVPLAGQLQNLTQLRFCDDPNAPRAFDCRIEVRRQTFDLPLHFEGCQLAEFAAALDDRSLPGGSYYAVSVPDDTPAKEVARMVEGARAYHADELAARPKARA